MFSGQGAQYVNMGLDLYRNEQSFRDDIDFCAEILEPHLGIDLRKIVFPPDDDFGKVSEELKQTAITQPALFVIEYALARLLISWGIRPAAMIGHSIGEYVAACLSGVFSLEDCLSLVALRGRLIQGLPKGSMLAIPLSEEKLKPLLGKGVSIAAVNSPDQCTVSGPSEKIELFKSIMEDQGIICIDLHTSHAFHSEMMEPVLKEYADHVKKIDRNSPGIPFVSNVTGTWITEGDATDPDYWSRHIRHTVRFADGMKELLKTEEQVLLEVGPGRTLKTLAMRHPHMKPEHVVLSSIRHLRDKVSDISFLLTALGRLWVEGVKVGWHAYYRHEKHRRVVLPTYPFKRQRYWVDEKPVSIEAVKPKTVLTKNTNISDWFYEPVWEISRQASLSKADEVDDMVFCWLIFIDDLGIGGDLKKRLKQQGQKIITVKASDSFTKINDHTFSINPSQHKDYESLISILKNEKVTSVRIVHLWNITEDDHNEIGFSWDNNFQEMGFYSLIYLAQAVGETGLNEKLNIYVISNNLHSVTGQEKLSPRKATALGPIKVIPQEYTNIKCCNIDIKLPENQDNIDQDIIENIFNEINSDIPDSIVAYRSGCRFIQGFRKANLQKKKGDFFIKENGVYLITGGLGGIGFLIALYFATNFKAKLILVSRSVLPNREDWDSLLKQKDLDNEIKTKIQKIKQLEEKGSEVFIGSADVSNLEKMGHVVKKGEKQLGNINGIIHSAGIAGKGMIQFKEPEAVEKIFTPKIKGVLVLDYLMKDRELDFFINFSSLTSIFGGIGMVDYCSANAFLDAFTLYKNAKGNTQTKSINWNAWQGVGMAVLKERIDYLREAHIDHLSTTNEISTEEGIEVFLRILNNKLPQIIVSTIDLLDIKNRSLSHNFSNEVNNEKREKSRYSDIEMPNQIIKSKLDLFYIPSWERTLPHFQFFSGKSLDEKLTWLVFVDDLGVGSRIIKRLKESGQGVISIVVGNTLYQTEKDQYTFNPAKTLEYKTLLKELHAQDKFPDRIIHCWNLTNNNYGEYRLDSVDAFQNRGFYSLLFLSQSLEDLNPNKEIQIVVLSNNMQEVHGEDLLYPEKATLLGPARVIPKKYPNITCKSVDIVIPKFNGRQGEKLINLLLSEIIDSPSNSIIAYRGNHRWKESFSRVHLDDKSEEFSRLKEDGVYLITGGLEPMGLSLAKYISQKIRAKIVLIDSSEFPPKEKWEEWLSAGSRPNDTGYPMAEKKWKNLDIDMEEEVDFISNMEMEISAKRGIKGLESYRGLEKSLNELCSSYIIKYLYQKDIKIEKGKTYNKNKLYSVLKILPAFKKLYDFFLRTLAEDNIIGIQEENIIFLKDEVDIKKPEILKKKISEKFHGFQGLLDLLDHCAENYGSALSEEMKAVGVLFPDGNNNLIEECGKNTVEYTNDLVCFTLVREILKVVIKRVKKRKLKILEVGAGAGRLTKHLLEELKEQDIEYYFTDVGKTFINNARNESSIGGLDFMKFGIFDITKDPEEQGYERFSFDIILGYDVVHATPVIEDTIGNLKKVLTPDGMFFLIENVKSRRWIDMIWGLAEGWWYFTDEDLRKESPLLNLDEWEEVLRKDGFKSVRAYPQGSRKRNYSDSGLIIAQQDPESSMNEYEEHISYSESERTSEKILKLKELEDMGSEIMVASTDVTNMEQMQSIITMTDEKFGHIDGVIHTAGIYQQNSIYRKTQEETERTLAPKVKGTLMLKSLLQERDLDFFILCSSMSPIKPLPDQVDYCAANAFLNAFAFYNANKYNTLTVSINWNYEKDLRLIKTSENSLLTTRDLKEITTRPGLIFPEVSVFDQILSGYSFPHIIVSPKDIREEFEVKKINEVVEESHETISTDNLYSRPDLSTPYEAPLNELEQAIAEIMQELLAIRQVGRMDDFFELGGDSLVATQFISRLRDALEIELHHRTVFENPTIAKLSKQIDSIQFEGVEDHKLREIMSEADMLTDLEIE
ncbi:MAG: SDR family NAD(P)-dependent oxidoreductase [Desulfobacteraceae bacterium]